MARARAEADKFASRYAQPTHDCSAFVMPCSCGYEEKFVRLVEEIRCLEEENKRLEKTIRDNNNSCNTKD